MEPILPFEELASSREYSILVGTGNPVRFK